MGRSKRLVDLTSGKELTKACHPERSPRSEGSHITGKTVAALYNPIEIYDLRIFLESTSQDACEIPSTDSEQALRFADFAQDDSFRGPFRLLECLTHKAVGDGKWEQETAR